MILGLVALSVLMRLNAQNQPSVEAVPSKDQSAITVDLFVRFRGGGPFDYAIQECIGKLAFQDTRDYGYATLRELTDRGGQRIEEESTPAGIHFWFKILDADASNVAPICRNLVYHPVLDDSSLKAVVGEFKSRRWTSLQKAVWPWKLPYTDIRLYDLKQGLARLAQPKNLFVTLACSGPYAYLASDVRSALERPTSSEPVDWKPDPLPFEKKKWNDSELPISWQGPSSLPNSKEFATNYLSLMILGGGKGSLIWQSWRLHQRWSYYQEADFISTSLGLAPSLFLFTNQTGEVTVRTEAIADLEQLASHLTEQDLARAKAFSQSVLLRGFGMNPLHALSKSGLDPLFLDNLWRSLCGNDPDWGDLDRQIQSISTAAAKANLLQLLHNFSSLDPKK